MAVPERDSFHDVPILAELRDALEARFTTSRARRRTPDPVLLVAIGVTVAVALVALVLLKPSHPVEHRPAHQAQGAAPSQPGPSHQEQGYIDAAQRRTVAHDRACSTPVNRGKTFIHGTPERALLSALGVLRRTGAPPDATTRTLMRNGFDAGAGVYVDYIRRARTAYGKSFYLIPEARTTPFGPVPERCYGEMTAALKRELRGMSEPRRSQILHYQAEQFAALRVQTQHLAGICFAAVIVGYNRPSPGGVDMGCSSTVPGLRNLTTGWLGEDHPRGGVLIAGMVPDGVGSVTLRYDARGADPARTITSQAINNVVVFQVPPHTAHQDTPTQFVVRAPDGRVIEARR